MSSKHFVNIPLQVETTHIHWAADGELMDNDLDISHTKAKKKKQSLAKLSLKQKDTIKSDVPLRFNNDVYWTLTLSVHEETERAWMMWLMQSSDAELL